jgi:hypothetical protein
MEFRITAHQFDSLLERYEVLGVPIAEQIRRAIDEYLKKHGRRFPKKERGDVETGPTT